METNEMKISNINIENFGIIKSASIDITPLTVFIGPNSSGKSFVAKLIHCFNLPDENDFFEDIVTQVLNSLKYLNSEEEILLNQITDKITQYLNSNDNNPLIISYNEIYPLIKSGFLRYLSDIFSEDITEQFEEKLDTLINFNENFFKIQIKNSTIEKVRNNDLNIDLKFPFFKNTDEKTFINIYIDENNVYINIKENNIEENINEMKEFLKIYSVISIIILDNILLEHSYYIPAERSEIIIDNKLLTRKIRNKSDFSKNQSEILANIINIDPGEKSPFYELGCELEKEFSGIHATIDNSTIFNKIIFKDSNNNEKISSKILSTSIHEISIFTLYLKYILKEGDLLIIEEPEAHLHPANQRILIKYFIRAINQGLKIMITTHSDYIISQIDNMINLTNVDEDTLNELNYTKNDILTPQNVNIYNFKQQRDNSYIAEQIQIKNDGFIEDNFTRITDELYDETITIRNSSKR